MEAERILSEIKSIRKKYTQSIFDLEKSKDKIKKLTSENSDLFQKNKKSEEVILKLEEEKKIISIQLEEAQKKIASLESGNAELREGSSNHVETPKKSTVVNKKIPRELRQLGIENNILQARLKQAECGIRQKESFERGNKKSSTDDVSFEVEKILRHKKDKRGVQIFLIRWKNYGPDHDTWEPESNLNNCQKMLERYKRLHKIL